MQLREINTKKYKEVKIGWRVNVESYDGSYPNLCSGTPIIQVNDKVWIFPSHCLSSNGGLTSDYEPIEGDWKVAQWPEDFPEDNELRELVVEAVNRDIQHGCCGGCA